METIDSTPLPIGGRPAAATVFFGGTSIRILLRSYRADVGRRAPQARFINRILISFIVYHFHSANYSLGTIELVLFLAARKV